MSKHIPGPWKAYPTWDFDWAISTANASPRQIIICPIVKEKNARLIAEAPEMLFELKFLIEKCVDIEEVRNDVRCRDITLYDDHFERLRLLVAKAEGTL